jgi:RNA polymerase sigma factor, sigma-70 family
MEYLQGGESLEEKELVARARSGDRDALEKLLYDNYKTVYGYLLRLTLNEETAKDFTQEAMVKAILHIKSFSGNSKFATWLVSIASNAYKDSLRKKQKMSEVQIEDVLRQAPSPENVEEKVVTKDSILTLRRVLMDIPAEKREVFILKHFYDYSYEEIAKILKCPLGTVRSRLHYCIKMLQQLL